MIKTKYVVSGNYEEYQEFLHKHRDDINVIYLYVNSIKDLKRKVNIEGYYTGTYYKRPDFGEIKEMIRVSKLYNAKVIHELTDGYTTEPVKALDNNHVVAKKESALNKVYGNVTEFTAKAQNYWEIEQNSMIDTMRNRD